MATNSLAVGSRILGLFLVILILLTSGLLLFNWLGLVKVREVVNPVLNVFGMRGASEVENPFDEELLERERVAKLWESLELREEELNNLEADLASKDAELSQLQDSLEERERALEEREKSFNEAMKQDEDRKANLRVISAKLSAMPPATAVNQILQMDDQLIIDLLRMTDRIAQEEGRLSLVSTWLMAMPDVRSADIYRKMTKKPES
jgi:flagellar protein FlbB